MQKPSRVFIAFAGFSIRAAFWQQIAVPNPAVERLRKTLEVFSWNFLSAPLTLADLWDYQEILLHPLQCCRSCSIHRVHSRNV